MFILFPQVKGVTFVRDDKDMGFSHISMWTIAEVTKAFHCCEVGKKCYCS